MDQKELTALKNKATELRIRAVDMIWKERTSRRLSVRCGLHGSLLLPLYEG